jgi:hypothetical protein
MLGKVMNFVPSPTGVVKLAVGLALLYTVLPFIPVVGPRIRAAISGGGVQAAIGNTSA